MYDISLIIPTYDRYEEIEKLLHSISKQTYPLNAIEVIIIDQNDLIDLSSLIYKYAHCLNINHNKTCVRGIANAKNVGIQLSTAPIITFPDDDCMYYEDTVMSVMNFFKSNSDIDIVYGRIYDRQRQLNIMRNWPTKSIKLNLFNFHLNYSAITCFSKRKEIRFDCRFGVGACYSSGEELDYIISALKKKYKTVYTNAIDIWHPHLDISVMPLKKIYNYAKGYGAICKKHVSFPVVYLFTKSVANQIFLLTKYLLLLNKERIRKHFFAIKGRLAGFMKFKNN
jgi:glycosyltransferase involved in cell wall biosynthesis